jgi:hypothetical protein
MSQATATEERAGLSGAWGLLAGLVSGLCCIGPSAAVLLGMGSSSALFGFQIDDRLAAASGGALLLAGVALALRRSRACELRRAAYWRGPAIILVTFALSYGLLGQLIPQLAAQQEDAVAAAIAADPAPVNTPELRRLTLNAEKLTCRPCAAHVRTMLKRKPFVHGFVVESGNEQVTIDYDSRQATAQKLIALFPRNYDVTFMSDVALP